MKLLILTQIVDKNDTNLGFFHTWIEKLAAKADQVYVICLKKGEYNLPKNVSILSLGKEEKKSKLQYIIRFYKYIFQLHKEYDAVFVHMNPEYIILGGIFWRLWHKKVLLWYTHKAVNMRLRLAEKFATKIFTASKESFRLPSKNIEVVGHGISVEKFDNPHILPPSREVFSLLGVGRITPSKDWETVLKALEELKKRNTVPFASFDIAGQAITDADVLYMNKLYSVYKDFVLNVYTPDQMPLQYQRHHVLIHTSRTGSMDKVVLEALAAGRFVVTSSEAYVNLAAGELKDVIFHFTPGNYQELANVIEKIYEAGILKNIPNKQAMEYVREHHNLDTLIEKISVYLK